VWLLFELGIFFSRWFKAPEPEADASDESNSDS
jgi:Sec-independent protein secretion pathway component TatC